MTHECAYCIPCGGIRALKEGTAEDRDWLVCQVCQEPVKRITTGLEPAIIVEGKQVSGPVAEGPPPLEPERAAAFFEKLHELTDAAAPPFFPNV